MPDLVVPSAALVIPARSHAMEQRLPKVFHAGLDDPATRLVIQRLIDTGAPAPGCGSTASALSTRTRSEYQRLIRRWLDFCGVSEEDMLGLGHDERCDHAQDWLIDRAPHFSRDGFKRPKNALGWWANHHGVDKPLTTLSRSLQGTKPGRGPAVPLTPEQLLQALTGLVSCEVLRGSRQLAPELIEGWHLRMLAAVTITVTCSLRSDHELRQLAPDDTVARRSKDSKAEGLTLRIGRQKSKHHRDIVLRPRQDLLCPVWSLQRWLDWCHRHQMHRPGGLLLPGFDLRRVLHPLIDTKFYDRDQWPIIAAYLEGLGHDMTNRTLHGCRAIMPTAAGSAGWRLHEVRDIARWKHITTAMQYVREHEVNDITARLGPGTLT